jgi:hypothetical protein
MTDRVLPVFFAMVTVACGSSTPSGSGEDTSVAEAYCAEVAKCCAQVHQSSDGQMCRLMLGSGSHSKAADDACLSEIRNQSAAGTFCSSTRDTLSACESLFENTSPGNKKPGEVCDYDSDCAPSNEGQVACAAQYDDAKEDWISQCQLRLRGKAGDSCLGTQDGDRFLSLTTNATAGIPASGYVCDTADGLRCLTGTCVALATVGQSCSYSIDCVPTAYCGPVGGCVPRVDAGGTCTGDQCVAGYYCPDAAPRLCKQQWPNFASCSTNTMCSSGNCEDEICQPNMLEALGWALLCD